MFCDQCLSKTHCEKFGRVCKAEGVITLSALDKQVSGVHYKDKAIQPIIYIHANNLGFCEGNVVKYVTRWRDKNGIADLEKAKHYIELLIEMENAGK
ncbi:SaV-like [uncultured Caudovirales phage]|uniref:SaV-like n=1 Tax=uncultured Caudovirales phage TaxID=2100421 RepID=A0A6J7WXP3_9CAUD|nr:SaV-like [uncultured Caudovirales phage]